MRVVNQVLKDIHKDIIWIVVFSMSFALIVSTFFFFSTRYRGLVQQNATFHQMEKKNVWFSEGYVRMFWGNEDKTQFQYKPALASDYFLEHCAHDDVCGVYLNMGSVKKNNKYANLTYLIGRQTEVTSYPYKPSDGIQCLAIQEVAKDMEGEVTLDNGTYPIITVPDEFAVFRFGNQYGAELNRLNRQIFILCPDFEDFLSVVGKYGWYPSDYADLFYGSCILVDPTEEDIETYQRAGLEGAGIYVSFESVSNYLAVTDRERERTHFASMVFYFITAVAFLCAMGINISRLMKKKYRDYTIHHMFGETFPEIYLRISLYLLGYQILGFLLFILLMKYYAISAPGRVIEAIGFVIAFTCIVSTLSFSAFKRVHYIYLQRKTT